MGYQLSPTGISIIRRAITVARQEQAIIPGDSKGLLLDLIDPVSGGYEYEYKGYQAGWESQVKGDDAR